MKIICKNANCNNTVYNGPDLSEYPKIREIMLTTPCSKCKSFADVMHESISQISNMSIEERSIFKDQMRRYIKEGLHVKVNYKGNQVGEMKLERKES